MTRYRVSWSGIVRRKFAGVERPGDCLYVLWVQHRADIVPGLITLDAAGEATFPVALESEVEAEDMHDAAAHFRARYPAFDMGGDVTVEQVRP